MIIVSEGFCLFWLFFFFLIIIIIILFIIVIIYLFLFFAGPIISSLCTALLVLKISK